jgi:tRNA(Ile)-lysidine synthase
MARPSQRIPADWRERWPRLALAAGLDPTEPVLLGLSGGADSVLLLHWLAASEPRPPLRAVHVHHGLRGVEADLDQRFCAELCRDIGVPFRARRVQLEPGGNLEERARNARYAVFEEEARRARIRVLLTGHHADDGLETLLLRWIRGSTLAGLPGPATTSERSGLWVVRPLLGMRRAEIRRLLTEAGLAWRDDSSNLDLQLSRNAVREALLPTLEALGGPETLASLRSFAGAVEGLERDLSARTASLAWHPLPSTRATRRGASASLGGAVRRSQLARLPSALQRRALWRLLVEGTARAPSRRLLGNVLADLEQGRCARHALSGGWSLCLRSQSVELHPPLEVLGPPRLAPLRQTWLAFAEPDIALPAARRRAPPWLARWAAPEGGFRLPVPGSVTLPDGRRISASWVDGGPERAIPRDPRVVELDLGVESPVLRVRWPAAGDRFHPLGGPGHRALRRFLADSGVPRAERRLVPLVLSGAELVWVAGLRPCHERRVQATTRRRLRLELSAGAGRTAETRAEALGPARQRQGELPFAPPPS